MIKEQKYYSYENGIYSYHIGTNQVNRVIFNSLNSKTEDLILDLNFPSAIIFTYKK